MAATQLSQPTAEEARKECLWPWTLKENSLNPSFVRAVLSDCGGRGMLADDALDGRARSHQVDDGSRRRLVLSALGVEQQALAGLFRPGGIGVDRLELLASEVAGQ